MTTQAHMGDTIKRLCGMHGMTQAELAKAVGLSPQTMTSITRGQVEARYRNYAAIFDFFSVTIGDKSDRVRVLRDSLNDYAHIQNKIRMVREA